MLICEEPAFVLGLGSAECDGYDSEIVTVAETSVLRIVESLSGKECNPVPRSMIILSLELESSPGIRLDMVVHRLLKIRRLERVDVAA